ncbi:hypothetical protein OSB04_022511 [Centaurea solstitialis]|uniref:VAN3-binding protein-like n=1 Tax=Centaurea solstitialis TaxID=347529 RepID=A0AA38TG57_9ASTR|nr:hypothetical protein OSB04_022511 [Centaurea solstitialis]
MEKSNSYPCGKSSIPEEKVIPQPETPMEPMEFLSRSWSISAAEISKAFAQKPKHKNIISSPLPAEIQSFIAPPHPHPQEKVSTRGKWFNHTRCVRKKDKVRAEKAQTHSAVCVAGLATAVASITAAAACLDNSRMSTALASATELLASHCFELAESAGADHHLVLSVVQSAINIQTPSDLLTLTAAAATGTFIHSFIPHSFFNIYSAVNLKGLIALRGEAALKARFPKEGKKNATVIPYDKGMGVHMLTRETTKTGHRCTKDVLQQVYKGVVYGVCNEKASWPFSKERENADAYFGVKTAKGLLEFKCKNKIHKQKWVDTIHYLLQTTNNIENIMHSMNMLTA